MITTENIENVLKLGFNKTSVVIELCDYNYALNVANSLGYEVVESPQFSYKGSHNHNYRVLDCKKIKKGSN
jgi:hypothetical protein